MMHVAAARRGDAAVKGVAVAPGGHRHDPGAVAPGNLLRTVGAAVVGDDHFAGDAQFPRTRGWPSRCSAASVSASFRQGITIESSIGTSPPAPTSYCAGPGRLTWSCLSTDTIWPEVRAAGAGTLPNSPCIAFRPCTIPDAECGFGKGNPYLYADAHDSAPMLARPWQDRWFLPILVILAIGLRIAVIASITGLATPPVPGNRRRRIR